jgi:hypothetical protein
MEVKMLFKILLWIFIKLCGKFLDGVIIVVSQNFKTDPHMNIRMASKHDDYVDIGFIQITLTTAGKVCKMKMLKNVDLARKHGVILEKVNGNYRATVNNETSDLVAEYKIKQNLLNKLKLWRIDIKQDV